MGYGGMGDMTNMMGGLGGTGMGIWGILSMLVFWVAFILLIVWLVKTVTGASTGAAIGSSGAKAVLDQRYAGGEITRKEYTQLKKDIGN
jgi:uncharacterized membrane protein